MELGIPVERNDVSNTGLYTLKGDIKNIVKCKLKKMNNFIINNNIGEIDIMKMDVEDAEFDILYFSRDILHKIKYLYIELNKDLSDQNVETIDLLENNGFHLVKRRRGNFLFSRNR